jgi:hypothetical protein
MSNAPQNNNNYWNGGAFCENCGILTGNVINNGIYPIWHAGCKPGCNSHWEDQDPIVSDDEYAHMMDEEERWREACLQESKYQEEPLFELGTQRSERDIEYDRRQELCKTPTDKTDEFEIWANEWGLTNQWDEELELEENEREEMACEDHNVLKVVEVDWETLANEPCDYIAEYRHPYHEDDEELEREARAQYEREMEAQDREEDEREEREYQESRYRYYYDSDSD